MSVTFLEHDLTLRLTMLDMFDGEGAKRAPGDLYLGREVFWVAHSRWHGLFLLVRESHKCIEVCVGLKSPGLLFLCWTLGTSASASSQRTRPQRTSWPLRTGKHCL